jgi:hypothetical protein
VVCLYCVDSVYGRIVCISSTDSVELMYEVPWPCMQNLLIILHSLIKSHLIHITNLHI